ncbi:MAG: glucokinase [Sphingosinicella sp.]|nr:glucokinase [Sphingosinicella sp.]
MTEIVAADIGGSHARFALAEVADGRVVGLGEPFTLRTAEHVGLEAAWREFGSRLGRPLPKAAGIAVAAPPGGEILKFTNGPWTIRPASLESDLGLDRHVLLNDFGAVAHAVAQLEGDHFRHLCGPEGPLPRQGVISIIGPGTGLGVALLLRRDGRYHVIETEGGHMDFAPLDPLEDRMLDKLRTRHVRVSVERILSGMGLSNFYEALGATEASSLPHRDEKALWAAALSGEDRLASAALDCFCLSLGAVAGDIALAHGAAAMVIAGGLGLRLADHLPQSGFRKRFVAKGRYEGRMEALPVRIITHPQPGLYGAAAAFAQHRAHGD